MITYVCKRTVVSTTPVQPELYFPLSVLDRIMEQNHLRIVYYYQTDHDQVIGEATKKLRESLSELLSYFPIMTGRLQRNGEGHWMIKCNDAGVRMVEARAQGSVVEWLTSLNREKERKLFYWEDMFHKPYFWSTFYVQLTEFEQGGLAIGLSCIHLLADPICATMIVKAWADKTLLGRMTSPPFFHPLPVLPRPKNPNHQPHIDLINHYKNTLTVPTSLPAAASKEGCTTIAFSFQDPMVRDCMHMSQTTSSPFEALAALFWTSISKVRLGKTTKAGAGGGLGGLLNMSVCSDARNVLNLDRGFFGNCIVYNKILPHHDDNDSSILLQQAAKAVREGIKKTMDIEGVMELIQWLNINYQSSTTPVSMMNGCDLICANLEGAEPYDAMFQDGFKPIRVSYYVEPVPIGVGQVLIVPSPPQPATVASSEGPMSRVVMVTLWDQDEVLGLCKDQLLKRFSPTILMGEN